ncbi:MAG: ABC transporter permease subunit [Nitrospinae bacterium]|nr:ABC transporter permease subunit [Nitrospinota bacterium]
MKNIILISIATIKGGIRDKTLFGLSLLALFLLFFIPLLASFSMRQVAVVACDFSLSSASFISLILTLFIGQNLITKDIDRRSIYTVISLPIKRGEYIIGKFLGLLTLILFSVTILSALGGLSVCIAGVLSPQEINQTISWGNYFLASLFIFLKLAIIAAILFLFSSLATSAFLPLSLAIAFYMIAESVEEVRIFIESASPNIKPNLAIQYLAKLAYYIFPNFEAFDLKPAAIYSLPIDTGHLVYLAAYSLFYMVIAMAIAAIIFERREFL